MPKVSGKARALIAALALVPSVLLASCGSTASTTTTSTIPRPSPARYSASGATVEIAFPSVPSKTENPASFSGLFAGHTLVTTWHLGNIGLLVVGSYELAIVGYPPGTPGTEISRQLEKFGGPATTTMYGRPAIRTVNPLAGHYTAILAFSVENVLIIAAGYDSTTAEVQAYIDSLRLIEPQP